MADPENKKVPGEEEQMVQVPQALLTEMSEKMAELERLREEDRAAMAGLETLVKESTEMNAVGEPKIREKKNFEPKFRTVRIRKAPISETDPYVLGYVVAWSDRGAYQVVDRTGVTPVVIDMLDVVFLGHERTKDNKLQVVPVRLLDFLNKSVQVHCKILEQKKEPKQVPTGEEIAVATYDPNHGLVETGDKIDGYIMKDEIKLKIQIPGVSEPTWIDAMYANA